MMWMMLITRYPIISSYIKLYGLKFSKEDHVNFIKILLEILCMPQLETSKVNKFCTILNELLRYEVPFVWLAR